MMMGFGALFSVVFIVLLVLGAIAYAPGWLPQVGVFAVVVVLVFAVGIWVLRSLWGGGYGMMGPGMMGPDMMGGSRGNDTRESALDILKQRYASGEISKAEYEEMRDDLAI
ncbi:MAG: SHOCT domain-containing protein [Anaerolineae bacterium]